jgi:hypothetical protein
MTVDTKKLRTVKSYATREKVTTKAVYDWIKSNKVDSIEIDGVKFIVVK